VSLPYVVPPVRRGPGHPRKHPLPSAQISPISVPSIGTPMPQSRVLAILNCYAPEGNNAAQLVLKSDGGLTPYGDFSLARSALRQIVEANLEAAITQLSVLNAQLSPA
jgi:hypothetical protein